MTRYGLDRYEVKRMLDEKLKEQPDLFYYLDDVYIEKLIGLLIDGIADIIEYNNKKLLDDLTRDLRRL